MATGVSRKISAASARSHTRRANKSSSFQLPSGGSLLFHSLFFFLHQSLMGRVVLQL